MQPANLFFRFVDSVGDGSGTKDMSTTTDKYWFKPTQQSHIMRAMFYIEDNGSFDAAKLGNNVTLGTGMTFKVLNSADAAILDLLDGLTIKTNGDIGRHCFDVDVKTWGTGNEVLVARWSYFWAGGPLSVDGSKGEYFEIFIQDDLSDLVSFAVQLQGYYGLELPATRN